MSSAFNLGTRTIGDAAGNAIIAHGDTIPPDGIDNYAPGALFINTAGENAWNHGDSTRCKFRVEGVYNALNYGARADGTTDDGAALQRAINHAAAAKRPCYLPAGTYAITTTLSLPSNLELCGDGAATIIKMHADGEAGLTGISPAEVLTDSEPIKCLLLSAESSTGIYIHDLAIDGNDAAIEAASHLVGFAGLALYKTTGCTVERVNIDDCNKSITIASPANHRNFCLLLAAVTNGTVRGGIFGNAGYETIGIRGACTNILIDGAIVSKHATTEYGRHALQIASGDSATYPIRNVLVTNCITNGRRAQFITHSADEVSFTNCRVRNTSDADAGMTINTADNVLVNGCIFESTAGGTAVGIILVGAAGVPCTNVVIANCLISSSNYCIDVGTGNQITIANNILRSALSRNCIECAINAPANDTLADIVITGNQMTTTTNFDNYCYGVHLSAVARAVVADNVIKVPANFGAVRLTGSADIVIERNRFAVSGSGVGIVEQSASSFLARENKGYADKNSGTAVVPNGATYVDITHGLALTPDIRDIRVTATNNLGSASQFWLSDIGAATFRINVDADPGATTATFAWAVNELHQ